jgi:hypothetical protein
VKYERMGKDFLFAGGKNREVIEKCEGNEGTHTVCGRKDGACEEKDGLCERNEDKILERK